MHYRHLLSANIILPVSYYTELGRGQDSVVFKCINISGVNIKKIVEILPNI